MKKIFLGVLGVFGLSILSTFGLDMGMERAMPSNQCMMMFREVNQAKMMMHMMKAEVNLAAIADMIMVNSGSTGAVMDYMDMIKRIYSPEGAMDTIMKKDITMMDMMNFMREYMTKVKGMSMMMPEMTQTMMMKMRDARIAMETGMPKNLLIHMMQAHAGTAAIAETSALMTHFPMMFKIYAPRGMEGFTMMKTRMIDHLTVASGATGMRAEMKMMMKDYLMMEGSPYNGAKYDKMMAIKDSMSTIVERMKTTYTSEMMTQCAEEFQKMTEQKRMMSILGTLRNNLEVNLEKLPIDRIEKIHEKVTTLKNQYQNNPRIMSALTEVEELLRFYRSKMNEEMMNQ